MPGDRDYSLMLFLFLPSASPPLMYIIIFDDWAIKSSKILNPFILIVRQHSFQLQDIPKTLTDQDTRITGN